MVIISTYLGRQIDLRGFLLETNPQPGSDLKHFAMSVLLRGMAKDIFRQEEQRNRCIFRHGFCHLIGEIGGALWILCCYLIFFCYYRGV